MKKRSCFLMMLVSCKLVAASIDIINLAPERWQEYKALRLEALSKESEALAVAIEDEEIKPASYWKEKLANSNKTKDNWLYFAESEGKLIGMLGAFREYSDMTYCSHLITISGMYVDATMRGKGVADQLMKHLLAQIDACNESMVCMLWVTTTKKAAIKLYEKNGFLPCGLLPKSVRIKNNTFDSMLMYKTIH